MLTGEAKSIWGICHQGSSPGSTEYKNSRQSFTPGPSRPNQRKLGARPGSRLGTGRPRLPRVRARFATNANFSPGWPILLCVARLGPSNTEEKRGSMVAEDGPIDRDVARKRKRLVDGLLEPQFGNLVLDYSMSPWKGELCGCGLKGGNLHYGRKLMGNNFHYFLFSSTVQYYLFIFLHFCLYCTRFSFG